MIISRYGITGAAGVIAAPANEYLTDAFVMTIEVTAGSLSFQWPNRSGTRNATIYWGDGSSEASTGDLSAHTYASAGQYDIQVVGTYTAPYFNTGGDRLKVIDIPQWGSINAEYWLSAFYGCSNMTVSAVDGLVGAKHLGNMFYSCPLANPDVSEWDFSLVFNTSNMFRSATAANPNFSSANFSANTNMEFMFLGCGITQDNVDNLLLALYTYRATGKGLTFSVPTAPSGTYQDPSPSAPSSGKEYEYILENDPNAEGFLPWTISY
jgi:hypothetical protein